MHRHGYKGRKFHRERDQRRSLIKGLAESLIIYESIETTLPKAKEVVPYVEKLITKAKKGDLHNRRQIISKLSTISTANKLVDEIAPKYKTRNSGHLRIKKTTFRTGDNAMLARVSFVEEDSKVQPENKVAEAEVKPVVKKEEAPKKPTAAKAKKVEKK